MARKNRLLIANMQRVQKTIDDVLPCVYAGIALALYRAKGWDPDQIREVFAESQKIWFEAVEKGIDMTTMCEDETGIDVVGLK